MQIPPPARLPPNTIVSHDRMWPLFSLPDLIAILWRKGGMGRPVPPADQVAGSVNAEIEHGRWIARCPNRPVGCGSAINASFADPIFICPDCGSPENNGNWYAVVFPRDREAIEAMLLKRPTVLANSARLRNWKPGESIADLRRENVEHGLEA